MTERGPRERNAKGQYVPDETLPDPELVRVDYEANVETLADVADKHRISVSTLNRMRMAHHWRQRQPRMVSADDLLARMFAIVETLARHLENHAGDAGTTDAMMLSRTVTALSRLIEVKLKVVPLARPDAPSKQQTAELRLKLLGRSRELGEP